MDFLLLMLKIVVDGSPRVIGFITIASAICFITPRRILDWFGVGDFLHAYGEYVGFTFLMSLVLCFVCVAIHFCGIAAKDAPRRNAAKEFENLSKEERDVIFDMVYFRESIFVGRGGVFMLKGKAVRSDIVYRLASAGFITKAYTDNAFCFYKVTDKTGLLCDAPPMLIRCISAIKDKVFPFGRAKKDRRSKKCDD